MSISLKKGDKIKVLAGRDKGKAGKVLKVLKDKNRVIVEGVQLVKKHMKRRSESEPGGIKEVPSSLHVSNVAIICPHCNKGVRFGIKTMADKSKAKVCKKCQQVI